MKLMYLHKYVAAYHKLHFLSLYCDIQNKYTKSIYLTAFAAIAVVLMQIETKIKIKIAKLSTTNH